MSNIMSKYKQEQLDKSSSGGKTNLTADYTIDPHGANRRLNDTFQARRAPGGAYHQAIEKPLEQSPEPEVIILEEK